MTILTLPHPVLFQKSKPVATIDETMIHLGKYMLQTMYENKGAGLAAPQVGYLHRVITINHTGDKQKPQYEYVAYNPVILERHGTQVGKEGCLSVPGIYAQVKRAKTIHVQFETQKGLHRCVFSGLAARVWQHEIDHLDGILFLSHTRNKGLKVPTRA